jgi:hypothetical protein
MVVLMELKVTALLRHRPLLTQETMRMQITTVMVGEAAQIVVQAAVAAIVVAGRVMMEVAVIPVVKTRRNNVGMDFLPTFSDAELISFMVGASTIISNGAVCPGSMPWGWV